MKILINVLYEFATLPLLHMRLVNHRFQNLIIKIVHSRLLLAASLKDRRLIFECYHPSAQYTEPYLFCDYLGTPGLSDNIAGVGSIYQAHTGDGLLRKLYSRFRPTRRKPDSTSPQAHPAGEVPGSRTSDLAASRSERQEETDDVVRRIINFDAHENFSQLVFSTDLVQLGPHRGLFIDMVRVNAKTTFRIFREWAAQQASQARLSSASFGNAVENGGSKDANDCALTWLDDQKEKVGVKIKVEERKWRRDTPILFRADEEQALSYSIELQGKLSSQMSSEEDISRY